MAKEIDFKKTSLDGLPDKKVSQGELGTAKGPKSGKGGDYGVNLDLMKNLSDVKINEFDASKDGTGGEVQGSLWKMADDRALFNTKGKQSNAGK